MMSSSTGYKRSIDYQSPAAYAKSQAQRCAMLDYAYGIPCDSSRHNALPGSAWDKWYREEYQRIVEWRRGEE